MTIREAGDPAALGAQGGLSKHFSESANKAAGRKLCTGQPGAASAVALSHSQPCYRPAPEHSQMSPSDWGCKVKPGRSPDTGGCPWASSKA